MCSHVHSHAHAQIHTYINNHNTHTICLHRHTSRHAYKDLLAFPRCSMSVYPSLLAAPHHMCMDAFFVVIRVCVNKNILMYIHLYLNNTCVLIHEHLCMRNYMHTSQCTSLHTFTTYIHTYISDQTPHQISQDVFRMHLHCDSYLRCGRCPHLAPPEPVTECVQLGSRPWSCFATLYPLSISSQIFLFSAGHRRPSTSLVCAPLLSCPSGCIYMYVHTPRWSSVPPGRPTASSPLSNRDQPLGRYLQHNPRLRTAGVPSREFCAGSTVSATPLPCPILATLEHAFMETDPCPPVLHPAPDCCSSLGSCFECWPIWCCCGRAASPPRDVLLGGEK